MERLRETTLLRPDQPVGEAVRALLEADLPALPVVDDEDRFLGVFGEREFIGAVFPGYMKELKYAAFVPGSLDDAIEKRAVCVAEPVKQHMTIDHVDLTSDASGAAVAETFLHHRVAIIPITEGGRVVGVVARRDFARELAERL